MNAELHTVLAELNSLAMEHGWKRVLTLTDEGYFRTASAQILISAQTETNTTSFQSWIRVRVPDIQLATLPLQELYLDPLPAVTAEKVIAVFECGRLIESDAVATITNSFFSRPFHSYAVVLSHAERIETENDLNLIERSVQRLLLSNLVTTWNKQDLLTYGVYLWSDTSPIDWLELRLQRDKDALATWLSESTSMSSESPLAHKLAAYRTLCAVDLAENELNHEERASKLTFTGVDQSQRVYNARQSISDLRTQLMRRVDASAESVERTMLTSLRTLQEDLLGDLGSAVLQQPDVTTLTEEQFRQLIADYIARGARNWQSHANELFASTTTKTVNDVETFVQGIDWPTINQVVAKAGKASIYPAALVEPLLHKDVGTALRVGLSRDGQRFMLDQEDGTLTSFLQMAAAGGITSTIGYFLGFGPIGAVAGGLLGLLGMGVFAQRRRSNQKMGLYEQYAREAIQHVMREVNLRVQEQVQENRQMVRKLLGTELSTLEIVLDQALHENSQSIEVMATFTKVRTQLQEFRERLQSNNA